MVAPHSAYYSRILAPSIYSLCDILLLQVRAFTGAGAGNWTAPALVCPGMVISIIRLMRWVVCIDYKLVLLALKCGQYIGGDTYIYGHIEAFTSCCCLD